MSSFPLPPLECPSLSQKVCLLLKSLQLRKQGGDAPGGPPPPILWLFSVQTWLGPFTRWGN